MMERIQVHARPASAQGTGEPPGETTLSKCFAANVCGYDVAQGKPAPDLFLLAAAALAVDPADSVVVEDAPAGVADGRGTDRFSCFACSAKLS